MSIACSAERETTQTPRYFSKTTQKQSKLLSSKQTLSTMMKGAFFPGPGALLAILLVLTCIGGNAQTDEDDSSPSTRLSLAASNPFRMIIRPTLFELDFVALSIVEEAMATAILQSTDSSLVDVSINVNQMNWLSSAGEDELVDGTVNALGVEGIPTTVLRFFAVGTFLLKVPAGNTDPGSLAAVKALDDLIEKAFSLENYGVFVELVRNSADPLLEGVQDAVAIRTSANPSVPESPNNLGQTDNDNDGGGSSLDVLNIVLVSFSIAIFLLLACMIFQQCRDGDYVENQRIQNLTTYRRNNNETSSTYSPHHDDDDSRPEKTSSVVESIKSESSKTSDNRQALEEQPSHASSSLFTSPGEDHSFVTNFNFPPSTLDINTLLNSRKKRGNSTVKITIESIHNSDSRSLPTPTRKAITSASSVQSIDERSECKSTGALSLGGFSAALSSDFGPINWFRKSASKGMVMKNSIDASSNIDEPVEEDIESVSASKDSTTSSSSRSSSNTSDSDVFRVGSVKVNAIASGSVANTSDNVSKTSSVVTDWMKTIKVVSSTDSMAESDVTSKEGSSSEQSSTAANSSTEAPEDGDEADEIESLEHSMANSKSVISGFGDDSFTMEF